MTLLQLDAEIIEAVGQRANCGQVRSTKPARLIQWSTTQRSIRTLFDITSQHPESDIFTTVREEVRLHAVRRFKVNSFNFGLRHVQEGIEYATDETGRWITFELGTKSSIAVLFTLVDDTLNAEGPNSITDPYFIPVGRQTQALQPCGLINQTCYYSVRPFRQQIRVATGYRGDLEVGVVVLRIIY